MPIILALIAGAAAVVCVACFMGLVLVANANEVVTDANGEVWTVSTHDGAWLVTDEDGFTFGSWPTTEAARAWVESLPSGERVGL